jgi:hypothetical protein
MVMVMTQTSTATTDDASEPTLAEAAGAFGSRIFEWMVGGSAILLVDVAHRSGLFEVAAQGSGTSEDLARRAGLSERHTRELLNGLTTAAVFSYDAATGTYTLPPAHAAVLTGDSAANIAPETASIAFSARYVGPVVNTLRHGGGIPYSEYRPEFTDLMDASMRRLYDAKLVDGYVPLVPGLDQLLRRGARVADIGCGTAHADNLLATAYPDSSFFGFDLADDAISLARREAADLGIGNARFEVLDVLQLPTDPPFDVVFAFDAIHDQVDPAGVLRRIHEALAPGGLFVMIDIYFSSNVEDSIGNPMGPILYTASLFHCMQVSLAGGGAGLGTCWGWQTATGMLSEAGFADVTVVSSPAEDPYNAIYYGRRV